MPHKDLEARRAYHRDYQAKHRERLATQAAALYQKNKSQRRAYSKQWYADHPDAAKAYRTNRRRSYPWLHLIKTASERAVKKGVPFLLTNEWGASRWTGFCELTGLPFALASGRSGPQPRSPSIDRIEPRRGYTPDNCRFVLACVNSFKHEGTTEDMYVVAEALILHRSQKAL